MESPTTAAANRTDHTDTSHALAERLRRHTRGEVMFDAASRGRYATDASIYQVMPVGVFVPTDDADVQASLDIARELHVPVLPRGAGTSQCGQTVGAGLVIDGSKHLRRVLAVDAAQRTATVQPGLVLDHLNAQLKRHGLWYPVDVSTSAQATLGGMAGNNSCGSRSIAYGNMVHNVLGADMWLADGSTQRFESVERLTGRAADIGRFVRTLADSHRADIETHWPRMLRRVAGYNLDIFHPVSERPYTADGSVNLAHLFVGAEDTPAADTARPGRLSLAIEYVRIGASILWQYLSIQWRIRRFENRVDAFAEQTHPSRLEQRSVEALAADLSAFLKIRLECWNDAALADTAAMVCYGLLKSRLSHWLKEDSQSTMHNDLLKGLPGLASALPVTKLWELSRRIENNEALKALFLHHSAEDILQRIREPDFNEFADAFDEYLERWGFRSSAELMLTTPTPTEDPRPLVDLLRAYLRPDTASPEARAREQTRSRLAISSAIEARISPQAWWRAVPLLSAASRFRLLLGATQGAIRLRERARMKQALLYTRLRHISLQLGDRLVERQRLQQRDDVFMLATGEVFELLSGDEAGSEARAQSVAGKVQARRSAMHAYAALQPPDRIVLAEGEVWRAAAKSAPESQAAPRSAATSQQLHESLHEKLHESLHGVGACGGAAFGNATVVLDVAQAGRIEAGQILVTRQTDPGWATVFFLVHGLVIERGGMLSHGAIIAREYGIPAVIGVADATRLIHDGDRLRVDGDLGLVEFTHV